MAKKKIVQSGSKKSPFGNQPKTPSGSHMMPGGYPMMNSMMPGGSPFGKQNKKKRIPSSAKRFGR